MTDAPPEAARALASDAGGEPNNSQHSTPVRKRRPAPTPREVAELLEAGFPIARRHVRAALQICDSTIDRRIAAGQLPEPDIITNDRVKTWSADLIAPYLTGEKSIGGAR